VRALTCKEEKSNLLTLVFFITETQDTKLSVH